MGGQIKKNLKIFIITWLLSEIPMIRTSWPNIGRAAVFGAETARRELFFRGYSHVRTGCSNLFANDICRAICLEVAGWELGNIDGE